MKVIVEYDKYNTHITKATVPTGEESSYEIALSEEGDKVLLVSYDSTNTETNMLEMTNENVMEISRLLSRIARGIEIKEEEEKE